MTLLLLLAVACSTPRAPREAPPPPPAPPPPEWPAQGATLSPPPLVVPAGFGTRRVFVVAGHGAPDNAGNTGMACQREEDFTLFAADDLAERLAAAGPFEVRTARAGDERPSYTRRLEAAAEWGADVVLDLHSDARAAATRPCPRSLTDTGFTVLWSEDGEGDLPERRRAIATSLADHMRDAGFVAYHGAWYGDAYDLDPAHPGVFVDRRGLMMLRRPAAPSVIVETHHAFHPDEVSRWSEEGTLEAFAAAVAAALVDAL